MKILVTGANGQLGKSIQKITSSEKQNNEFFFTGRSELDFSQNKNIEKYFEKNSFDVIINCAAYTSVDKAESEVRLASQINHLAVEKLAEITLKNKVKLIHISTDYVFNGKNSQPYIETTKTDPINIYGKTKLAGEKSIQAIMPTNAIIIRVSWLYSEYGNNFVSTMLKLAKGRDELNVVSNQIGSPTYATDLASVILKIIKNKEFREESQTTQIYHYSNEGEISWYEFAKEIFQLSKIQCSINPIPMEQYPAPANRPKNTLMNKDKIAETFDINTLDWKESLNICIAILGKQQ